MRLDLLVRLGTFLLLVIGMSSQSQAVPVEYVKICSLYGAGFYYIPGTDTCLNPTTGETRKQTENGTVTDSTVLSKRVGALESESCDGCFAVVDKDGTTVRGFNATRSVRYSPGVYAVVFGKDVAACAFNSTIGDDHSEDPGVTTVEFRPNWPNTVFVRTFTIAGQRRDRGFHLSIVCPTGPSPN